VLSLGRFQFRGIVLNHIKFEQNVCIPKGLPFPTSLTEKKECLQYQSNKSDIFQHLMLSRKIWNPLTTLYIFPITVLFCKAKNALEQAALQSSAATALKLSF